MNIVLVGTGNVAVVISQLLISAGHFIVEVHGRNEIMRHRISQMTGAESKANFSEMSKSADLCLIAVSDSAITEIIEQLSITKMLIVHTSGATTKEVLNGFDNYGVLYPLQSLRKEMTSLPVIPFFTDANSKDNIDKLCKLVQSTHNKVNIANDEERLRYHMAAVLCSNFTNHLYALTDFFCQHEQIDFKNLFPLIQETAARLQYFPAAQMQTGPAIRQDENTIQRHLDVLQSYPDISHVYQLLTKSIQAFEKNK